MFMRFHYYIGLILKCNEISEKIRHLRKRYPLVHTHGEKTRDFDAYLQVLYQVVKYPQAFWVLTVLDVDQRTNFCRLNKKEREER